jgi:hypothetical protein
MTRLGNGVWSPMWVEDNRPPPVTLPQIALPPVDKREIAAHFVECRTIKMGLDCWREIGRAESFENWLKIGKALMFGKQVALRSTGANRAWGATYSKAFGAWMKEHGFGEMKASVRSVAVELAENAPPRLLHGVTAYRRSNAAT